MSVTEPTIEAVRGFAQQGLAPFSIVMSRGAYQVARVHRSIAWHLQAVEAGRINRLWIRCPPRHGKSRQVSRDWPAWLLGRHPDWPILLASHTLEPLAAGHCAAVRDTLNDPEYRAIFPGTKIKGMGRRDSDAMKGARRRFETTAGGGMFAAGVRGSFTGSGGRVFVIDDPVKDAMEADSPTYQQRNLEWYIKVALTRLTPDGAVVGIDTSWGDKVLGSVIIRQKGWHVLSLPGIAEENDPAPCCAQGDWRKPGEALWPERWPEEKMRAKCAELMELDPAIGARAWQTLFQQRAVSLEGEIIKRDWTREEYIALPDRFDQTLIYVDPELSGKASGSWCVALAWGRLGARFYLLPIRVRIRAEFHLVLDAVAGLMSEYPDAACYWEPTATGPAAVSTLRKKFPAVLLDEAVRGSKGERLGAVAPLFEAGNVVLPCRRLAPWIDEWRDEIHTCPHGRSDDYVDATSGGLRVLQRHARVTGFQIPTADQPDYWTPPSG